MFSGSGFGTFMEASRLLRFLFLVTDLKELSQLLTGGLDLLRLQASLDYVEGICYEASQASGYSSAKEVP